MNCHYLQQTIWSVNSRTVPPLSVATEILTLAYSFMQSHGLWSSNNYRQDDCSYFFQGKHVPCSPTPEHSRIFKLLVLDHIAVKLYIPSISSILTDLFYLNNDTNNLSSVIYDRSTLLKKTLSQTLSQFHPIAGKVERLKCLKDYFQIDCNDEGVYCIETRINKTLSDFCQSPGDEVISQLIPQNATESSIGNYVLMI